MEEDDDNCPDCGYIGKGEDFAYHDCRFVLRQRVATLEAEKAERERQGPVAWAWNDSLGCMHVHCGSRRPHWVDDECSDSMRAELSLRPLYAHPLALRDPTDDECKRIANEFLVLGGPDELAGRVMFNAVREVMTK